MSTPPLQLKPAALHLGRKNVRVQLALLVLAVILPAFLSRSNICWPSAKAPGKLHAMNRISRDISAQKRAADQIHTLAFYDA